MKTKIFITGSSGFIGFHVAKKYLEKGYKVYGFDSMSSYYDTGLKKSRLKILKRYKNFLFKKGNLENQKILDSLVLKFKPSIIIHLAAQAGVRYSIQNPKIYLNSNLVGTYHILEAAKKLNIKHLIIGSSSSVYGANKKFPFQEIDKSDNQISFYAATKKSTESLAHSYSSLWKIPTTILRFFTVYGPWGRPDMALFLFTKAIIEGESIKVFNNGDMIRDFTYIDDLIESLLRIIEKIPESNLDFNYADLNPSESWAPFKILNIGNSKPTNLMDYISCIEDALGIKAKKEFLPMQPGDVQRTESDTDSLNKWIGFKPNTSIKDGVNNFVKWYLEFYY